MTIAIPNKPVAIAACRCCLQLRFSSYVENICGAASDASKMEKIALFSVQSLQYYRDLSMSLALGTVGVIASGTGVTSAGLSLNVI